MIPNISKSKAMYISTAQNNKIIESHTNSHLLKLKNQTLEYCSAGKLLGITVDQNLSWKMQVEQALKKCNTQLYLLLRIKHFLNLATRKLFFNAYILPQLDYCCTIWGNCGDDLLNKVVKLQKRAARVILDKDFDTPTSELFKELNWMTFPERIRYKKAILMYKLINNTSPEYLSSKFCIAHTTTDHELRSVNKCKLLIPKPRIEFFRKSLSYSGPAIWNEIPVEIRFSSNLSCFKRAYLKWKYSDKTFFTEITNVESE